MSAIIGSVFSLFFILLVGVYGSKKNIITSNMNKGLTDILINIALPCMIFSSFIFTYDNDIKSNIIKTLYYSLVAYMVIAIISYILLLPIKDNKKTILHFANVFTNTGYVGFPILNSIYGAEGVIYGSIFNMFFVFFVWTYGIMLFKENLQREEMKDEIKKILLNPSIIAVFLGIFTMLFEIQLPLPLLSSIKSIGDITIPLSMMIIGSIISQVKIKKYIKDWTIYYGIFSKLIIIPLIIYCILLGIGDMSKPSITVIVMSAMPASTMTSILAESFGKEREYAAIIVSITTLFSLITVPLLLRLIM